MKVISSKNLSKLILLSLSSLPVTAFSMNYTVTEKMIFWFEHDSIPESVENYAATYLNIDLNTDEGREEILQLLSRPKIENAQEARLFESVASRMRTLDQSILDGMVSTIMVQEITF